MLQFNVGKCNSVPLIEILYYQSRQPALVFDLRKGRKKTYPYQILSPIIGKDQKEFSLQKN